RGRPPVRLRLMIIPFSRSRRPRRPRVRRGRSLRRGRRHARGSGGSAPWPARGAPARRRTTAPGLRAGRRAVEPAESRPPSSFYGAVGSMRRVTYSAGGGALAARATAGYQVEGETVTDASTRTAIVTGAARGIGAA